MTTSFWDIPNADVIVFMGSNAAENHPIGFKWFLRAKQKGAKLIVVDPRFTRTASKADWWIPFRSGTDISVLGGLINYAISHNKIHRDYVIHNTNAPLLINPNFKFDEGLFSGWDPNTKTYNQSTWSFQTGPDGQPLKDDTLQDPNSVYQQIKKIYSLYTPEMVSEISGITVEDFNKFAEMVCNTGEAGKVALFAYAMGWTQSTHGVQNIRCATLLQMLLGNIGVPGGGIAALRGHANVQGATDLAVVYGDLPGYVGQPTQAHKTLKEFNDKTTPTSGFWVNKPKYVASLLKAWWGDHATKENDFGYNYLPKMGNVPYSHYDIFQSALDGKIHGLMLFGQNPAVGSANASKVQAAMAKLDWMLFADMFMNESGEFWKLDGVNPADIKTEVFFLPACGPLEKAGSFTNSTRLIQWKHQAIPPMGESRADGWIVNELGKRLQKLYANSTAKKDEGIKNLTWGYDVPGKPDEYDHEKVLKEMNGYDVKTGKQLANFGLLKDDGSTAAGIWIYTGVFTEEGNKADSRKRDAPNRREGWAEAKADGSAKYLHLDYAFAWPANRRILYNRASSDPAGKSWGKLPLVWWDAAAGKWTGVDVPDMLPVAPDKVHEATGVPGSSAFIMKPWGMGGIWGPLADGPVPVHYEPIESPVKNALYKQTTNPAARRFNSEFDKLGTPDQFPYVVTTYRLTEHQTSGAMTRTIPFLAEAFARPFVELSRELAQEKGIKNGDWVQVESARGKVKVQAMVTNRLRPYKIAGKLVHQIGLPIHWAPKSGFVQGDIVNSLSPEVLDPTAHIQESKAFLGNISKTTPRG
jgi:formate dehydrogenase-N alpha subunit